VLECYEYQDTPFEKIVEELNPDRDTSFSPLLQLAFGHSIAAEHYGPAAGSADALEASPHTGTAKFDFSLELLETPDELLSEVEYRATLYTVASVRRFVDNYQRLLRAALGDPERPLADLDLLVPEERAMVLAEPARATVEEAAHDLVVATAASDPDRIAVATSRTELCCGDLLARSARVMAALRAAGVGPGTRVGVYVPDAVDELVALLGVARAAGAAVPLSRFAAVESIRARLAATGTTTVLAAARTGAEIAEITEIAEGARVVALDALPEVPSAPRPVPVELGAPALIGEEGFCASHRALAASVQAEIEQAGLAPGESTLIADSCTTLALHDALAVWAAGGTVVLPDLAEQGSDGATWQLAEARRVVRAYAAVEAVRELAEPGATRHRLPELRQLMVEHRPGLLAELGPGLQVLAAGCRLCERLVSPAGLPVLECWAPGPGRPRGRPRAAVAVRILDDLSVAVPLGIPGSVVLIDQDAASSPAQGGSRARTQALGIFGRWLDDGSLQLLGRSSARLRVRGYEVDRDLVESVLRALPGVRAAAVTASQEELRALLEGSWSEVEARARLGERLPAWMVPTSLVQVTRLPRAASGEVDRTRLGGGAPPREGAAARTDFEQRVVTAFCDELGWDAVGIHDDFLSLGGHCREAQRIAAALSTALTVSVEATDVFFYSRAEALAIALAQRSLAGEENAERLLAEIESLADGEAQILLSEEAPSV
jgi:non-ribosomal peptide synthetase component F